MGARSDHNSEYGDAFTFRTGYIGIYGNLVTKLLYGEAFQEPSARQLYGGWTGTGSDPDLRPEESRTYELSLIYTLKQISQLLSLYHVTDTDTILNLASGGRNVGRREVYGLDYHLQAFLNPSFMQQLKLWGYYSYIRGEGDEVYNATTDSYEKGDIGDLAHNKIFLGATGYLNGKFTGTLRGRFIGARKTVATNPVDTIDSYLIADFFLLYRINKSFSISFKVDNIFDTRYEHPGVRSANSGDEAGYWSGGTWYGSKGWFNSVIPQPGRTIWISLSYP
jgi:outer membrane receptor protein involved in Fe transport